METINERLAALRKHLGLNVTDFAREAGIDRSRYTRMESGPNKPALDAIESLAANMPNVSLDWLLTGSGPMLRDGRALAPVAAPVAAESGRPAPLHTEPGQVDFVNKYITRLEEELEAATQREAWLREMLKKPLGNLAYAAEPTADYATLSVAPAPIGFRSANSQGGTVRAMWPAGVLAEVTHKQVG